MPRRAAASLNGARALLASKLREELQDRRAEVRVLERLLADAERA